MQKSLVTIPACAFAVQAVLLCTAGQILAQEKTPYPAMAPAGQYMMDEQSEIALARSAAPKSISDDADVMVLGRSGYVASAKGKNGFLCIVERSWGAATDDPEFWNPKVRAPICFNPAAAKTFARIYLLKTRFAMGGRSKAEILQTITSSMGTRELPPLEPGAMCYMMSKQQYLNDRDKSWHPHLMFFIRGDAAKEWGANLPGSPVIAANDPEERATIFMVRVGNWSDGTGAPATP